MHHVTLLPPRRKVYHYTAIIEPVNVLVQLRVNSDGGIEVDERVGSRFLLHVLARMGIEVVLFSRLEDRLLAQLVPNLDEHSNVSYVLGLSRTLVGPKGVRYRPLNCMGRDRYVFIHADGDPNSTDANSLCMASFTAKHPDSRLLNLLVWLEHMTRFPNMGIHDFIELHRDQIETALRAPLATEGYVPPIPMTKEICQMAETVLEPSVYDAWLAINREIHCKPVNIPAFPDVKFEPPKVKQPDFQLPNLHADFLRTADVLAFSKNRDGTKATVRISAPVRQTSDAAPDVAADDTNNDQSSENDAAEKVQPETTTETPVCCVEN